MNDFRMDCALGIELKKIRIKYGYTLKLMSDSLGWNPAKLSNYEHNIGALTDSKDAAAIDFWCIQMGEKLYDNAINLSNKAVKVDLTRARALIKKFRDDVQAEYEASLP